MAELAASCTADQLLSNWANQVMVKGIQINGLIEWLINCLIDWSGDYMISWSVDWLDSLFVVFQDDWFIDWLTEYSENICFVQGMASWNILCSVRRKTEDHEICIQERC